MTKTELLALADRIEAAPEGSREIDGAIYRVQFPNREPTPGYSSPEIGVAIAWYVPAFTTGPEMDLSAAWSLRPAGWSVDILDCHFYPGSQNWRVKANKRKHSVRGTHARLDCALCAAALRARAAETGDEG